MFLDVAFFAAWVYGFWTLEERHYQQVTVRTAAWMLPSRRVLIVAPTGAGKTVIGALLAKREPGRVGFLTHTKDLVVQSAKKLRSFGLEVGVVASGHPADPFARVQVVSVQTALARELELKFDLLILDEAHHFAAEEWRGLVEVFGARMLVGLTATPERGDGKPLGDLFDELVVAASYSELIAMGHLVPCRVFRPRSPLERGLAQKVLESYRKHGEERTGFVYARRVKECEELCREQVAAGLSAMVVSDKTPGDVREHALSLLSMGGVRLLNNVYALTEGVDVPSASVAVLARKFGHPSLLLQTAGRILRPCEGKRDAILIDLPGVTHVHGLPTEDREYSLTGKGIRRTAKGMALRICMMCGMTSESDGGPCPRCGHKPEVKKLKPLQIHNEELRPVYDGKATPSWAKRAELDRLRSVARAKGYDPSWIQVQYQRLFGERAPLGVADDAMAKKEAFQRLAAQGRRMNYNPGWAQHRYRTAYGSFPPKSWVVEMQSKETV